MVERADEERDRRDPEPLPTPEQSWARHIRVLEFVDQIRRARAGGRRQPDAD
jgi:hypothetical protein